MNENGVPNYYYEKPDVGTLTGLPTQSDGKSKKIQKKEDDLVIGRDGCPACNKKRHSKYSTCPNYEL